MALPLEPATLEFAEEIASLELACFPEDEAASLSTIQMRLKEAGGFFWMLRGEGKVIGFINGTCIDGGDCIHHESMTTHVTEGTSLVIHSVSVSPSLRRRRLGLGMLVRYIQIMVESEPRIENILLLSKADMLELYLRAGLTVLRKSKVVHGQDVWFECGVSLRDKRRVRQHVIDAFTKHRFAGNPAAVILLEHAALANDENWMQSVAGENNLSETAFLSSLPNMNEFTIRWFTPTAEVALCGHATLASAHFLQSTGRVKVGDQIVFKTKLSGLLSATCRGEDIELDFPAFPPTASTQADAQSSQVLLLLALPGLLPTEIVFIGRTAQDDLFVEITAHRMELLRSAAINFGAVKELGGRGLILSSLPVDGMQDGQCPHHFVSRFFAPCVGVPEDPATGSAHCSLAPYYQQKLFPSDDVSSRMLGFQASKRGAEIGVLCCGDRVKLYGSCITTIESTLL